MALAVASGKIIHTSYRWERGAMHPRPRPDRAKDPRPSASADLLARLDEDVRRRQSEVARSAGKGDRRHLLGRVDPTNGPRQRVTPIKVAATGLGLFWVVRLAKAQGYPCARCERSPVAKVAIRWTDVLGTTGWICTHCYDALLADPLSKPTPRSRQEKRR